MDILLSNLQSVGTRCKRAPTRGKFGITLFIHSIDLGSAYGAAGSLVVLLFWVFYSSVVLYFGAAFTNSYALAHGLVIKPKEYAITVKVF